jgi:hypothetical protein
MIARTEAGSTEKPTPQVHAPARKEESIVIGRIEYAMDAWPHALGSGAPTELSALRSRALDSQ